MEIVEIKFLNWEKYQGDGKRHKTSSWFRLQNDIWMHPLWDGLTPLEFKTLIFLFSYVSKKAHRTGSVVVHLHTLSRMSGIGVHTLLCTTLKLEKNLGVIALKRIKDVTPALYNAQNGLCTDGAPGVHGAHTALPNLTQPYQKNKAHLSVHAHDCADAHQPQLLESGTVGNNHSLEFPDLEKKPRFDFEPLYEIYPLKRGRKRGLDTARRVVKTQADYEALSQSIRNYAAEYEHHIDPKKFFRPGMSHFSTFMANEGWKEWIAGTPKNFVQTRGGPVPSTPPAGIPPAEIERTRRAQKEIESTTAPTAEDIQRVKGLVQQITGIPR